MDKDSWVILIAFVVIVLGVFIYLASTGTVNIDWNAVFNVKTYPKN
jgi:uncharacterized membrane protein (Fun14 family)